MKDLLKRMLPGAIVRRVGQVRRGLQQRANGAKSLEQVFTDIYLHNRWGGAPGEYCSGSGTITPQVVEPYVGLITERARTLGFAGQRFVDLGCGDFRVGQRLAPLCSAYVGVDVVAPLVQRNQSEYGSATVQFRHLDIVRDPLPEGDVCFVRQVLQHLSNAEIATVLGKLGQYRWVFITEHYPTPNPAIRPNRDKANGADIRLYANSGVYLEEPPFSLPRSALELVLEAAGAASGEYDPGIIRTYQYEPKRRGEVRGP